MYNYYNTFNPNLKNSNWSNSSFCINIQIYSQMILCSGTDPVRLWLETLMLFSAQAALVTVFTCGQPCMFFECSIESLLTIKAAIFINLIYREICSR